MDFFIEKLYFLAGKSWGEDEVTLTSLLRIIFQEKNIPIFFLIQSIYICFIFRTHTTRMPWFKSLLFSFFMIFTGRELAAFACFLPSPLIEHVIYFPIFLIIWFMINSSPYDIAYKFLNNNFVYSTMHLVYSIVQIAHIYIGIKIGKTKYDTIITGLAFVSTIYSSSESLIFIMTHHRSRNFSSITLIKHFFIAILLAYQINYSLVNYPTEIILGIVSLFNLLLSAINIFIYGLRSEKSIDITLITYILGLLPYNGSKDPLRF